MTTPQTGSRTVCWYAVYEFVAQLLTSVGSWPTAGTPDWVELVDGDPRKLAAVLDAGVRWSLRVDTEQEQRAQASHDVAAATDWSAVARDVRNHTAIRIRRAS